MAAPAIINAFTGSWSVADALVTTQPVNQMLNIPVSGILNGDWLIAMVGWHEVPQLPTTVAVGDDAGNLWTPVVTSPPAPPTNQPFLLNQNASFQSGLTSPWTVTNGTLTASTVETYGNNPYSGRVVNNGTGATVSITSGHANIGKFSPNLVTASAYVWYTNGTSNAHVDLNWYNAGGALISTTTGPTVTVAAGTWTNLVNISAPPSGAVAASLSVSTGGTPVAANVWYVSNAGVATTGILNTDPYFTLPSLSTYWTATNATITAATAQKYNNQPAIAISPTGSAPQVSVQTSSAYLVGITGNQYYTGSIFTNAPSGYYYVNAYITWYDSSKTLISTSTSNNTYAPPGQWAQASISAQAPTSAAYAAVGLLISGTPQPWNTIYMAQATLTPMAGYSSVARAALWVAPNVLSTTTQVSISPLGQATAMIGRIWQVANMPVWLEVDTATAVEISQSSSSRLTLTPSQTDFVVSACAASLSQQWTLDRDSLNGWTARGWTSTTNNVSAEGDLFVVSTGITTSGGAIPTFYDVDPLNNNPVFAASVSGWSTNNSTLVSSSAFAWPSNSIDSRLASARSALWTPNGTSATVNAFVSTTSAPAVTPGGSYQGDAYLYSPAGWSNYSLTLLWLNSSHTQISAVTSATFAVPAATWTNTAVAGIAPSGAAFASVVVNQTGTPPAAATTYIGRGTVTQANSNTLGLAQVAAAFRTVPQNQPAVINTNWPNLRLEAAFGYPSSTPPDQLQYVDISNRLLSVAIKRGRQYELNALSAGEADFVLRNDDGLLTPSNPNSPYKIQSYTPIRVTAIWNNKVYPVFVGYMERWPEVWTDPHWGEVNAIGVDAWAMFVGISPSIVKGERLLDYPFGYWPCADGNSSTTAVNIGLGGNTTPLTVTTSPNGVGAGTAAFGGSSIKLVGDNGTDWGLTGLLSSQGSQGFCLTYNGPPLPPINEGVCVTWWMYVPYPGGPITTQARNAIFTAVGLTGPIIQVWMAPDTTVHVTTWNTAGVQTDHVPNTTGGYSNRITSLLLNFSSSGYTLYFDSGEVLTGTDQMATYWSFFTFCGRSDLYSYGNFANMSISHVAVFPRQLGFSRMATYIFSGTNAMADDFGDWRVSRLMSYMLWTVPHRVYYDSSTSMLAGAIDISGKDFGSAINDVSTTERSLIYVDKAGYLTYRTRLHSLDRGVQAVFGENTAAGELPYLIDVELDYDPQYVYNDFQVTHQGTPKFGSSENSSPIIYAKNLTSINQYGDRGQQLTSYFLSSTQSVNLANWLVNQYSQPQPRVQQVKFSPMGNPALFSALLELDVGDRVTLNRRPVGASQISLDVVIIGVHHDVDYGSGKWIVTYDLMPTVIASLAVKTLTLNDPVLGLLDSGNVIGW